MFSHYKGVLFSKNANLHSIGCLNTEKIVILLSFFVRHLDLNFKTFNEGFLEKLSSNSVEVMKSYYQQPVGLIDQSVCDDESS